MYKLITLLTIIVFTIYCFYIGLVFNMGINHQILVATTPDSYPLIPNEIGQLYLKLCPSRTQWENNNNKTVVSYAIAGVGIGSDFNQTADVIKTLNKCGADLNSCSNGLTPLHEAVLFGEKKLIQLLIQLGAEVNITIKKPTTHIHGMNAHELAMYLGEKDKEKYTEIIKLLETNT